MKLKYSLECSTKDLCGKRFALWGIDKYVHFTFEERAQAAISIYPWGIVIRQRNKEDAVKKC